MKHSLRAALWLGRQIAARKTKINRAEIPARKAFVIERKQQWSQKHWLSASPCAIVSLEQQQSFRVRNQSDETFQIGGERMWMLNSIHYSMEYTTQSKIVFKPVLQYWWDQTVTSCRRLIPPVLKYSFKKCICPKNKQSIKELIGFEFRRRRIKFIAHSTSLVSQITSRRRLLS